MTLWGRKVWIYAGNSFVCRVAHLMNWKKKTVFHNVICRNNQNTGANKQTCWSHFVVVVFCLGLVVQTLLIMNLKQWSLVLLFLQVGDSWRAFLLLSLCLQSVSWIIVFYWSRRRWHNHPISKVLQAHVQPPFSSWGSVAVSINTEFRHIDKFATGAPGARVIVTDTWVLKVSVNKYAYSFSLAL